MVTSVEQSLAAADYAAAARKLQLLPKAAAGFSWDDSKVPAAEREELAAARDAAIAAWVHNMAPDFQLKAGAPADIEFEFEKQLQKSPTTGAPAGLATFVSETTLPRIESVSGLTRGADGRASTAIDVQNDVEYAIGRYLGVADRPVASTAMARTDAFAGVPNVVSSEEVFVARRNLEAVQVLRQAIHAHIPLQPLQPKASFDQLSITYGPVMQGTHAVLGLLLTNIGQAPLAYRLVPSCSCITVAPAGQLRPSEAKLLDITVDTTEWSLNVEKPVMVLTNDPDDPVRTIPLKVLITPRYRWIVPAGPERLIDDSGSDIDLFLEIPFGSEIYATGVRFEGVPGSAKIEQWSGDMADPAQGQGVEHRDGYRIRLHVKGPIPGGRQLGSVVVSTTSREFPEISYSMGFQSGIVALPTELNLGAITGSQRTYAILLRRPQKPFKVLAVESTSKSLKVSAIKVEGTNDYRVTAVVGGKMTSGDFFGVIHVYTDDPRQPKIDISVHGTVE